MCVRVSLTAVAAVVSAAEGGEVRGAAHAGGRGDVGHPLRRRLHRPAPALARRSNLPPTFTPATEYIKVLHAEVPLIKCIFTPVPRCTGC